MTRQWERSSPKARRSEGLGLVSAIFLLVVLSLASAVMLNLVSVQGRSSVLSLQAIRATYAAKSGVQWGMWQILDTGACPAATTLTLAEGGLNGFSVDVACSVTSHTEGSASYAWYEIDVTARAGSYGSLDYVQRRMNATLTDAP